MDRGTDSINNLLNYIVFSIAPTILDLLVAVAYFVYAFNWWFGLIVFLTMFLYIGKVIKIIRLIPFVFQNILPFYSLYHCNH